MSSATIATYCATIFVAGSIETAKQVIRERAYAEGQCVTVTPTTFIYTGGEEDGTAIGLVAYPRFPRTDREIFDSARHLALALLPKLNQRSALIVAGDITEWISITPPGGRESGVPK